MHLSNVGMKGTLRFGPVAPQAYPSHIPREAAILATRLQHILKTAVSFACAVFNVSTAQASVAAST